MIAHRHAIPSGLTLRAMLGRLHEQGIFGNESTPQFHPNQKWDGY
jgi:hypothetical protein